MPVTLETSGSVITVDQDKIKRNVERIRRHIGRGVEIMYTAKAGGYGFGLVETALYLRNRCSIRHFSTGLICEAIALREAGIDNFLLVMGGVDYSGIPELVRHNLIATVYEDTMPIAIAEEARRQGKRIQVHIKIDTGLRRYGVQPGKQLAGLIRTLQRLPELEIQGVFTHMANGYDLDKSFTRRQLFLFEQALSQLQEAGIRPPMIHAANTAACVASPEAHYDIVRVAALIFGYDISPGPPNRLGLEPAMTWTSKVLNVLWAEPGENVSYYGYFIPKRRTRLAIVSFGMADGYNRNLATTDPQKNGDVLIRGKRGRLLDLNFDQTFVDVTDIPGVAIGDTVTLVGRDGDEEITTQELARRAGTSNGHICCAITSRPFRRYIGG